MSYVTGIVGAVPNLNKQAYIEHATHAARILKEQGALRVFECWGDDVPDGQLTSFPLAVKCQPDESVVFSWIIWPDKAAYEKGMPPAMKALDEMNQISPMPFDGKRVLFGNFESILET